MKKSLRELEELYAKKSERERCDEEDGYFSRKKRNRLEYDDWQDEDETLERGGRGC